MVKGMLDILHDLLLANHLLDFPLRVNVHWVHVQPVHPLLVFTTCPVCFAFHPEPFVSEAIGVVGDGRELRCLLAQACQMGWVAQHLLSHTLRVRSSSAVVCGTLSWSCRIPLRDVPRLPDEHSQHLAVLHASVFECLRRVGQRKAIEEEVLVGGGEGGLGFDKGLEVLDGEAGGQVQRQQVLVGGLVGSVDGYGDARPVCAKVRSRI